METKNYIGQSRPSGTYNKQMLSAIESNLNYFNEGRRSGVLTVEHYVDTGDRWKLSKDNQIFLDFMTLEELYFAVASITNYMRK